METFLKHSEPVAIQYPPNSGIYTGFITGSTLLKYVKLPNLSRKQNNANLNNVVTEIKANYTKTGVFDLGTIY